MEIKRTRGKLTLKVVKVASSKVAFLELKVFIPNRTITMLHNIPSKVPHNSLQVVNLPYATTNHNHTNLISRPNWQYRRIDLVAQLPYITPRRNVLRQLFKARKEYNLPVHMSVFNQGPTNALQVQELAPINGLCSFSRFRSEFQV